MKKIAGDDGTANGTAVLEAVVYCIIYPSFMAHTSWTGRAGKGQPRKIPLSKYANVVKLISDICCKADHDYSHERCLDDFKYKIIKYAHSKYSVEKGVETCNAQPIAPQHIAPQPVVCVFIMRLFFMPLLIRVRNFTMLRDSQ